METVGHACIVIEVIACALKHNWEAQEMVWKEGG